MSDRIDYLVARIDETSHDYQPGPQTFEGLGHVTLTAVIGPYAIGKNTIMNAAASLDSNFACVTGFTTRPRRPGEPEGTYRFLEHSPEILETILKQVEHQELVQIAVHPTTGNIYGSALVDYAKPFMLLDTLPGAIKSLEVLPFGALRKIAVTAEPATWASRRQDRDNNDTPATAALRLDEGIANLRWSLNQGSDVIWVENGETPAIETAQQLIDIVKYGSAGETTARRTAEKLLAYMESIASTP